MATEKKTKPVKSWSLGKFLKVSVAVGALAYLTKIIAEQFN